jgi:hypothetical protein
VILPGPGSQDDPDNEPTVSMREATVRLFVGRGRRRRVVALGTVLALCLLGATVGWVGGAPSRIEDALHLDGDPRPGAFGSASPDGRPEAHQAAPPDERPPCQPPLSVVAAEDIAGPVRELAGPLTEDPCPQVTVTGETPATTLAALAGGGRAPDVWIPDSTLWLRLAPADGSVSYPAAGTSIARTPVVIALPQQLHDAVGRDALPAWVVVVDKTITGEIPRMSMPARDTAAGALALVSLNEALRAAWAGDPTGAFLRLIHFRNSLAATEAESGELLESLAGSSPARAGTEVGVFPATEQQLLAYGELGPAVPAHRMGTYDASIEADFPVAVAESLDDRRAAIAEELLTRLRAPAAVRRLVGWGFRPPTGDSTRPAGLADTARFPDYPAPVALPDAAGWHRLVEGWTVTG